MTGEDWNFKLESFVAARRMYYTKWPVNPWDEAKVKRRSEAAREHMRKMYKAKKDQLAKEMALMEMHAAKWLATDPGACVTD